LKNKPACVTALRASEGASASPGRRLDLRSNGARRFLVDTAENAQRARHDEDRRRRAGGAEERDVAQGEPALGP
jgi:hypothetical protein